MGTGARLRILQGLGGLPRASGARSGKYTGGGDEAKRLDVLPFKSLDDAKLDIAKQVDAVADEAGVSSAQVALAWCLNKPGVTSVIFGARTIAQLDDNLAAAELELPAAAMTKLDEVSGYELGYPYDFMSMVMGRWY